MVRTEIPNDPGKEFLVDGMRITVLKDKIVIERKGDRANYRPEDVVKRPMNAQPRMQHGGSGIPSIMDSISEIGKKFG